MVWETWLRLFNYFVIGSGLNQAAEESRLAALYLSLGTEGARICASLCPEGTKFKDALEKLTTRFGETKSNIYARAQFHRRTQQSGESVLQFVTELRSLITHCHYDAACEEEVLRDRFFCWCSR